MRRMNIQNERMDAINKEKIEKTICPHSDMCGGCSYQGVEYAMQLKNKEGEVRGLLEEKALKPEVFDSIEPSPKRYSYRNKMEYSFGDLEKGGEMTLGMHRKKMFMSIATTDECQIVPEDFNTVLKATLDFCKDLGYSHYNKRSHNGLLRNLILRCGVRTNQLLVNIVTQSDDRAGERFDEKAYADFLLGLDLKMQIVGVLRTENNSVADAVIPEKIKVVYGNDYYVEELLGLKFKVSAFSFFQTNVDAVEKLYTEALNLVDSFEGKNVFDLYSGTGTISQVLGLKAKHVLGIELVEEAVEAAKLNAKINNLTNVDFIAGDVFEVLKTVEEKPDVIVVDPPRAGIQPKALDKIISYGVNEIVYISCNPKTLVNNLYYLEYNGYKVKYLKPFDNFPFTKHTECIALVSRE